MTDVKIIDADQALASLREAVAERGEEYVYSNPDSPNPLGPCVYAYNGKPMCGVGVALHKLGIPIEDIDVLDTADEGGTMLAVGFHNYQPVPGFEFTEGAAKVFNAFQETQDILLPWGEALVDAIEAYDSLDEA